MFGFSSIGRPYVTAALTCVSSILFKVAEIGIVPLPVVNQIPSVVGTRLLNVWLEDLFHPPQLHPNSFRPILFYAFHFFGHVKIVDNPFPIYLLLPVYMPILNAHFRRTWTTGDHKRGHPSGNARYLFHDTSLSLWLISPSPLHPLRPDTSARGSFPAR